MNLHLVLPAVIAYEQDVGGRSPVGVAADERAEAADSVACAVLSLCRRWVFTRPKSISNIKKACLRQGAGSLWIPCDMADSRLFLFGGYDGITSYHMMMYLLDLAYLLQVTSFTIDVP